MRSGRGECPRCGNARPVARAGNQLVAGDTQRAGERQFIPDGGLEPGRSYWLLPGGGPEGDEMPEAWVQREVREETHLLVEVGQHLRDDPDMPGGSYQRLHTYLCRVIDGEARPGYEPEDEAAEEYAITAVRWLDLRQPAA